MEKCFVFEHRSVVLCDVLYCCSVLMQVCLFCCFSGKELNKSDLHNRTRCDLLRECQIDKLRSVLCKAKPKVHCNDNWEGTKDGRSTWNACVWLNVPDIVIKLRYFGEQLVCPGVQFMLIEFDYFEEIMCLTLFDVKNVK